MKRFVCLIAGALLTSTLMACGSGGGTSGTGGGFNVSGVVRTAANMPISGLQVSVASTTASSTAKVASVSLLDANGEAKTAETLTDNNGHFDLQLDSRPGSFSLLLSADSYSVIVAVPNVPQGAASSTLNLQIDEEQGEILAEDETFEDEEGNELPGTVERDEANGEGV